MQVDWQLARPNVDSMHSRAKVILINGSFGVGKTSVARAIRKALSGSAIYDPEYAGPWLWRIARWVSVDGSDTDDFQDMPAWRRSVVLGTRFACLLSPGPVVVPMTFDNPTYFAQVWSGIGALEPTARAFCLTATLATIRSRLVGRGTDLDGHGSLVVWRSAYELTRMIALERESTQRVGASMP